MVAIVLNFKHLILIFSVLVCITIINYVLIEGSVKLNIQLYRISLEIYEYVTSSPGKRGSSHGES